MAKRGKTDTAARHPEGRKPSNGAILGFEQKLWQAADKLRNNMDAAEYKHVVLGLMFLKYISDAFQEHYTALQADKDADPEDRDEYAGESVFWVPKPARWEHLRASAKQPTIGKIIDDAMVVIEKENPVLKGVLPKDYARPTLDKRSLGELIDLVGTIGLGDAENRSKDILGRVYEYFLKMFASAEGKKGGQFWTPRCVVRLLVAMLAPHENARIFDPCCGSGGMFVQSEEFIEAHGGRREALSIFGQESNPTTWRLARMNLAIRHIEANLGAENADSFHRDLHKDLKADFVLANPHFNDSDWGGERLREDVRWKYGVPPAGNANYAWVQHFIHHLSPKGRAGFVLANSSMSANQSGEGDIRKAIVEADLVDCMVALPSHLFYSMPSQVCLWFITRDKVSGRQRDRRGETLFIDARNLGTLVDRTHRELTEEDITRLAGVYNAWRFSDTGKYKDVPGFCRSVSLKQLRAKGYVLGPGRYVGSETAEDDGGQFADTMARLTEELADQVRLSHRLDGAIEANLTRLGFVHKSPGVECRPSALVPHDLNRIELSRRMNTTLERIAKALFRSWFVDFDPVRAKAEDRDPSLPKPIADLFPDALEDSELGEIPKGWRIGKYSELLSPSAARIGPEAAAEYSATVTGLALRDQRFNKPLSKSNARNKRITKNDLVFGLSRKVVNFGLMRDVIGSVSPVYEVFTVNPDIYVPELLEMNIRYHMPMHMDILKPGAREGQPIDRDYLLAKELLIPDMRVQQVFHNLFSLANAAERAAGESA